MIREIEVRECHVCSMHTPASGYYCGWCGNSKGATEIEAAQHAERIARDVRREAERVSAIAEMHNITRTLTSHRIPFNLQMAGDGISITAMGEDLQKWLRKVNSRSMSYDGRIANISLWW